MNYRTNGAIGAILDEYEKASRGGWLLTFVLLAEKIPVGHCNVYITNDMHNNDLIAQEDTIYVLPEHRNGVGKKMIAQQMNFEPSRKPARLHCQALQCSRRKLATR